MLSFCKSRFAERQLRGLVPAWANTRLTRRDVLRRRALTLPVARRHPALAMHLAEVAVFKERLCANHSVDRKDTNHYQYFGQIPEVPLIYLLQYIIRDKAQVTPWRLTIRSRADLTPKKQMRTRLVLL